MQISPRPNVVAAAVALALLNSLRPFARPKMASAASVDYCYSDIGCFPLSDEFYHPKHRPFNVRPWHRSHINTQFELFNKDHPDGFMLLAWDKAGLARSKFNPKLETKIIVPGWLDNINRALWVRKLKDALLYLWVPVNVIVVRWTNFTPYTIATANTRVVGAELANLMKFIDAELSYDPAYYHIIGHSLGAHIAGYCGDRVHGLGRITALDPARPFFQHMPKSVRLDRSDAKFIDAIHSDFTPENAVFLLMSYGMTTPVGHLDFYPNGPPLYQPGCIRDTLLSVQNGIARGLKHNSLSVAFLESIRYLTACDHQRSHEWFIESITNRECAFVGVRCNEFEGMINGRCTCDDSPSACAIMGIHADQMYLNQVHEELWPVRAGSIDYKYKKSPKWRPRAPAAAEPARDVELADAAPAGYNLLSQAALAEPQLEPAYASLTAPPPPVSKDEIYAQLKYQAMQMHNQAEPMIAPLFYQDQETGATEAASPVQAEPDAEAPGGAESQGDQVAAPSEMERLFDENANALDDLAFAGYLRNQLILQELEALEDGQEGPRPVYVNPNATSSAREDEPEADKLEALRRADDTEADGARKRKRDAKDGQPGQFAGHPKLVSSINRDIESWYEDNGRWHLKTNNQPRYCSNQYQLLIFLGPLKSSRGRDRLRADLLVSIVGSKGQLLNQRFVPRGSTLTSFTMQPFFILLEGSYSLGQIKSVALSWEARHDPDPVQATISFQSNELQALGEHVAIYKAKQFPWLPEEFKHDKSSGFSHRSPAASPEAASLLSALSPSVSKSAKTSGSADASAAASAALYQLRYKRPSMALKSIASGHYSQKYGKGGKQLSKQLSRRSAGGLPAPGRAEASLDECSLLNRVGCQRAVANLTDQPLRRTDADGALLNSLAEDPAALEAAASQHLADYEDELAEYQRQVDELNRLKQENLMQRDELEGEQLELAQREPEQQTSPPPAAYVAKSQMPNQTYLAKEPAAEETQTERTHLAGDLNVDTADPYFVRLVDPLDDTASLKPKPGTRLRPEHHESHEGKITIELHNSHLKAVSDEDSIVVNQIIVSPLQANYGRHGRNAKTFCPPMSKQKLTRDKTLRLSLSMLSRCSDHHHYQLQMKQLQQLRLAQEQQLQLQQQGHLLHPLEIY